MRHGQALSNVKNIVSSWPEKFENQLTDNGRKIVKESAESLADKSIDLIFVSPLLRTQQTAEIVGNLLKIKPETDSRLREIDFGVFNGGSGEKMWESFKSEQERIIRGADGGENYSQVLERMYDFLEETDKKYKGKNILIISHEGPLVLLQGKAMGFSLEKTIDNFPPQERIHKSEIRELN